MINLASKTLEAINEALEIDQGAEFRTRLEKLLPKMEDAYKGRSNPFRSHLGISTIGSKCPRQLHYGFHWCTLEKHSSQTLRLFNRGHLEEARFISMLQCAGLEVFYETEEGGQFKISNFNGHFGSALDSVVKNCPDLPSPDIAAYGEFKTHNEKSFKALLKHGLRESKFVHFVQMQMCMSHYSLEFGLYLAVNKNTDEIYGEIIELDRDLASRYLDRAKNIIFTDQPPPRISNDATWFECKWCKEKDLCHGNDLPRINCRTCFNAAPNPDGGWTCIQNQNAINTEDKYKGCELHLYNPNLINKIDIIDGDMIANYVKIKTPSGNEETWGPDYLNSVQLLLRGLE